ncbi:MAG: hypothetical protein ACREMQ_02680 [Longimicrobiales bacterium]
MRTNVAGSSFRLLLVPSLVLLALACNDITPLELPPVTGPATAPPAPGYDLTLTAATLSSLQGSSASPTALNLVRTNFTGYVTLSVENLPTGVSASFYPNATSGSSSRLWLSVAGDAPTGTFTNLLVRGVASGLADRTAPLTLTITEAPFAITLSSPALTIVQGIATPTTVNVIRNNFTDPVTLVVDYDLHGTLPPGVTAAWEPNPVTGNSSVLTLMVSAAVVPGVYELWVWGYAGRVYSDGTPLTLTVTERAGTTSR